jgi:predicted metal-binding protein
VVIEVDPEWQVAVLVCTNSRDPATGKTSCGAARGAALADAVKDLRTAAGQKGRVLVSKTGCLGVCSPRGVTVCAARAEGPRQVWVACEGDAAADVWGAVERMLRSAQE